MIILAYHIVKIKLAIYAFITINPFNKLSTRLDNELDLNIKLSINFILYIIVLPLSRSFLMGTENVIYFSVFSPKYSNYPSNFLLIL